MSHKFVEGMWQPEQQNLWHLPKTRIDFAKTAYSWVTAHCYWQPAANPHWATLFVLRTVTPKMSENALVQRRTLSLILKSHVLWRIVTDSVQGKHVLQDSGLGNIAPRRLVGRWLLSRRIAAPPASVYSTTWHGVTSQKTWILQQRVS